jgi:hypothetical protein
MLRRTVIGLRPTCSCQTSSTSRMTPRANTFLPMTSVFSPSSKSFSTIASTTLTHRYPSSTSAAQHNNVLGSSRPRAERLDIKHGHLATGWALDVVQRRGFKTSSRREMTAASLAFGAAALLKVGRVGKTPYMSFCPTGSSPDHRSIVINGYRLPSWVLPTTLHHSPLRSIQNHSIEIQT